MKNKNLKKQFYFLASALIFMCAVSVSAQTTVFTYQGKLTDTGTQSATYDFEFRLCDSPTDCSLPLETQQIAGVPVSNGVFTVTLDFNDVVFDGSDRWLEIAVKRPAQGTYTTLTPRQPLTSAPYSIKSRQSFNAENLGGISAGNYLQTDGDGSNLSGLAKLNSDNVFTGTDNAFPQITLSGDGQIIAPRLENSAADPAPASAANAGRIYFNTTDNSVKVSNGTAWINLSAGARQIQTFSGQTAETTIRCDLAHVIRSISFTKSSAASRLRITYRDKAKTAGSANFFGVNVNVKINGTSITPLLTVFDAENSPFSNSTTPFWNVSSPFTTVGSVSGIAAGTHTLTSEYIRVNTANAPVICYVTNNPYFVEIEEIP